MARGQQRAHAAEVRPGMEPVHLQQHHELRPALRCRRHARAHRRRRHGVVERRGPRAAGGVWPPGQHSPAHAGEDAQRQHARDLHVGLPLELCRQGAQRRQGTPRRDEGQHRGVQDGLQRRRLQAQQALRTRRVQLRGLPRTGPRVDDERHLLGHLDHRQRPQEEHLAALPALHGHTVLHAAAHQRGYEELHRPRHLRTQQPVAHRVLHRPQQERPGEHAGQPLHRQG